MGLSLLSPGAKSKMNNFRQSTTLLLSAVVIAVITDIMLFSLVIPSLPRVLRDRAGVGENAVQRWISICLASFGGSMFVSSFAIGPFTDQFKNKQTPFTVGLIATLLSTILYFTARSAWLLAVARAFQGISTTFVWTSGLSLLHARSEGNSSAMIGIVTSAASVGELSGVALGGVLFDYAGEGGIAGFAAALISIDFVLRLLMSSPDEDLEQGQRDSLLPAQDEPADIESSLFTAEVSPTAEGQHWWHISKDSLTIYKALVTDADFMGSMWACIVATIARTALESTLPLFVQQTFNWSTAAAGGTMILVVFPSFGGPFYGKTTDRYGPRWLSCRSLIAMAALFTGIGFVHDDDLRSKVLFCLAVFCIGVCVFSFLVAHISAVTKIANDFGKIDGREQDSSGTAFSLMNQAMALGRSVGPLWAGFTKDRFGWLPTCLSLSACFVVTTFIMAGCWRKWPR